MTAPAFAALVCQLVEAFAKQPRPQHLPSNLTRIDSTGTEAT